MHTCVEDVQAAAGQVLHPAAAEALQQRPQGAPDQAADDQERFRFR